MFAHSRDIAPSLPGAMAGAFTFLHQGGWAGVDLFFVLSGFLVSGLLFDEHIATGAINLKRFFIRRGFKIIPAFYVLVLVSVAYDLFLVHRVSASHLIHDVLFLQSYREGAWGHAWTLSVEVHFYLLLGLLLWYLSRHVPKSGQWLARLPAILAGVLAMVLVARLINSGVRIGQNFNFRREICPTHLHLDVLAAGVLLRYLYTYHAERLEFLARGGIGGKIFWTVLALLLVAPSAALWSHYSFVLTALIPTLNYLGFGILVILATRAPFPAGGALAWLVKPMDYFGKHSYSIYLWHLPVKQWVVEPLMPGAPGVLYFLVFVTASLIIGTLFSELLEMPILHLRNRLFPSRAKLNVPAGTETATVPA